MALHELVLASQDLVCVQNYRDHQSIALHKGGLIAWASTKQRWHHG